MTPESSIQLTNLHYFFSTAPQVLGALLAITGAFVVFKIDSLKKDILGKSQHLIDFRTKGTDAYREVFRKFFDYKEFDKIKYSQIANEFDVIEGVISKGYEMMKDNDVLEKNDSFVYLKEICGLFIERKDKLDSFRKGTRFVFAINGLIIIALLSAFFYIPNIYVSFETYRLTLVCGFVITSFSLSYIVLYLIRSVSR